MSKQRELCIKHLGLRGYSEIWELMQAFTDNRSADTQNELWLVEHPPVFTLGLAGKKEHLLNPGEIPIVQSDRGGQVTYHGPGQLVAYILFDLRRAGIGVRRMVETLENSVINLLKQHNIEAHTIPKAPGVYVDNKKVAALGLRVRHGCTFHGLSLNVDMDLEPFTRINPCGYAGLEVTQLKDLGVNAGLAQIANQLVGQLEEHLAPKN